MNVNIGGNIMDNDQGNIEDLKSLCQDLLKGMDKCSAAPYYIIQPFLSIIKKHSDTIKKYDLV